MLLFALAAKYQNPPFTYLVSAATIVLTEWVLARKGPRHCLKFLPSLILLELLERYTHLGHR
ncbi:unnamed protein product [Prunus armeniaca]